MSASKPRKLPFTIFDLCLDTVDIEGEDDKALNEATKQDRARIVALHVIANIDFVKDELWNSFVLGEQFFGDELFVEDDLNFLISEVPVFRVELCPYGPLKSIPSRRLQDLLGACSVRAARERGEVRRFVNMKLIEAFADVF